MIENGDKLFFPKRADIFSKVCKIHQCLFRIAEDFLNTYVKKYGGIFFSKKFAKFANVLSFNILQISDQKKNNKLPKFIQFQPAYNKYDFL